MRQIIIKCKYGVTYTIKAEGSNGAVGRLRTMLSNCCCYVCYNRSCAAPHDSDANPDTCSKECTLFTKKPYCLSKP